MSSWILQTWQHRIVFSFGLSEISQNRGFTIMIVSSTFPFAVGYFLTKFFPCCLWLGFSQFKRKISQIHILITNVGHTRTSVFFPKKNWIVLLWGWLLIPPLCNISNILHKPGELAISCHKKPTNVPKEQRVGRSWLHDSSSIHRSSYLLCILLVKALIWIV